MITSFLLARFIWQENTPKMQMDSKHAFTWHSGLSPARETQKEQTFNSWPMSSQLSLGLQWGAVAWNCMIIGAPKCSMPETRFRESYCHAHLFPLSTFYISKVVQNSVSVLVSVWHNPFGSDLIRARCAPGISPSLYKRAETAALQTLRKVKQIWPFLEQVPFLLQRKLRLSSSLMKKILQDINVFLSSKQHLRRGAMVCSCMPVPPAMAEIAHSPLHVQRSLNMAKQRQLWKKKTEHCRDLALTTILSDTAAS